MLLSTFVHLLEAMPRLMCRSPTASPSSPGDGAAARGRRVLPPPRPAENPSCGPGPGIAAPAGAGRSGAAGGQGARAPPGGHHRSGHAHGGAGRGCMGQWRAGQRTSTPRPPHSPEQVCMVLARTVHLMRLLCPHTAASPAHCRHIPAPCMLTLLHTPPSPAVPLPLPCRR